jgi:hypothetical protein
MKFSELFSKSRRVRDPDEDREMTKQKDFEHELLQLCERYKDKITPAIMLLALEKQTEIVDDELWLQKAEMQGLDPKE